MAVCVVADPYVAIEWSLRGRGHTEVVPFYDLAQAWRGDDHPLSNGWVAPPFTDLDYRKISRTYASFGDDVSRAHYLQFLAWRRLREEWYFDFAPVTNVDRYFPPEVTVVLRDDETFLDCGSYDGRVSLKFAINRSFNYRRIVMVEPDSKNRVGGWRGSRDDVLDCALAEIKCRRPFFGGFGFASKIGWHGRDLVDCKRVDDLDVAPTFIKLHLEGGELDALAGARETVAKYRPIIAATVYHDSSGIWATMDWMMSTFHDYQFLFRNHCWCGSGAVVYAIPVERRR